MNNQWTNIQIIGFDLDHTLYPPSPEIDHAIQSFIIDRIAEIKSIPRPEAQTQWNETYAVLESGSKTLAQLGIKNGRDIVQTALEEADILGLIDPNPALNQFLTQLTERYTLDLITGSRHDLALAKLARIQIDPTCFDNLLCAEISKSNGDAFRHWLDLYPEIKPDQFLYIGDRYKIDVLIPQSLGMQAILVNTEKDLSDVTCLPDVASLADQLL